MSKRWFDLKPARLTKGTAGLLTVENMEAGCDQRVFPIAHLKVEATVATLSKLAMFTGKRIRRVSILIEEIDGLYTLFFLYTKACAPSSRQLRMRVSK